ncbi:MAG TPA: c(7)-type cytochrome triheme domain-containing protein [Anaeromyxobacteraceae bacterium]|nr:c(7)-type cytochrome triheme domain-containing protein [Anaeromyxobacteraceae bacterium]
MTKFCRVLCLAFLSTALLGLARAGELPKLPKDYSLPSSEGSPGTVVFSHSSHVDAKQPGCTRCHPALFRTLAKGSTADGQVIVHKSMEQGRQCGACHGKSAFGFDSCDMCHHS